MMERLIQAGRSATIGWTGAAFADSLSEVWRELLPFLGKPACPRATAPEYSRRGDHLFIADAQSAKHNVHFETISLCIISTVLFCSFVWIVAALTAVPAAVILSSILTLFYLFLMVFKLYVVAKSIDEAPIEYSQHKIDALRDEDLPVYTILVPLREEAEVMEQIVASLSSIEYPAEKLDLIMTVEEYDVETRAAIERSGAPGHWRVVVLPDTTPKTKPKALNVAFLEARGEFLVIYDAEIMPERDQLKKAVLAFRDNPEYAVFQTRLDHYNTDQSILTKLFTTEFTFHYDMFLPGLARLGLPIPLSGHSTHFRMEALRRVGAWDPYNVAEDCEVGIRLFRRGYRAGMIDSMSREEATATLHAWITQRTRWMKGFIQSSIVHLRYPVALYRDLGGMRNFLAFLVLVPGTIAVNVCNLVTWILLVVWFISGPEVIQSLYPLPVLYVANLVFLVGGFLFVYFNLVAVYQRGKFHLVRYWILMPFYWLLLSVATVRAIVQLCREPHCWEKTVHGTHLSPHLSGVTQQLSHELP